MQYSQCASTEVECGIFHLQSHVSAPKGWNFGAFLIVSFQTKDTQPTQGSHSKENAQAGLLQKSDSMLIFFII